MQSASTTSMKSALRLRHRPPILVRVSGSGRWTTNRRRPPLAKLLHHLETFWARRGEANIEMFHYHDLTTDLSGQMRRLADTIGLTIADQRIKELATAATFDQLKKRAVDIAPNSDQGLWRNTEEFFHRGGSGQWRNLLDDVDLERYDERVSALVPPDLAVWSHQGWLGSELPALVDPGSMLKESR